MEVPWNIEVGHDRAVGVGREAVPSRLAALPIHEQNRPLPLLARERHNIRTEVVDACVCFARRGAAWSP